MAGDYSSGMEEKKRGRPREKMRAGTARGGDYGSGMEEKKPKPKATPKPKPAARPSAPFSSAVEGEAQAASREAAKRQAARAAASTVGRGVLGTAARFAGPVGAITTAALLGDSQKDTKPALWARDKVAGFLNRRTEYKQEQADKAAMEAARKRGEAKRDAGKPDYMSQVSANALKKFQDKAKVSIEDVPTRGGRGADIGAAATKSMRASASAPKPPPAKPKAAAVKKRGPSEMKSFMADFGEDSDNAVFKRLREKGYAKGGQVKADGCARKGKTRGRII